MNFDFIEAASKTAFELKLEGSLGKLKPENLIDVKYSVSKNTVGGHGNYTQQDYYSALIIYK